MRFATLSKILLGASLSLTLAAACGDGGKPTRKEIKTETPSAPTTQVAIPEIPQVPEVPVVEPVGEPIAPQVQPMVLPETFEERLALGKKLVKQGKLDDAVIAFEGALALGEEKGVAHTEMARVLLLKNDPKTARTFAEKGVELEPTSSSAWNTLGRVSLMERKMDSAIAEFARATDENHDNIYAWNNMGLALMQMKRYEESIEAFETATAGKDPEPYMWNNLGMAYEKVDRVEDARISYVKGAEAGSNPAAKNLARIEGVASQKAEVGTDAGVTE
jgi:tetratricopeptide (TPR) repeat protein